MLHFILQNDTTFSVPGLYQLDKEIGEIEETEKIGLLVMTYSWSETGEKAQGTVCAPISDHTVADRFCSMFGYNHGRWESLPHNFALVPQ